MTINPIKDVTVWCDCDKLLLIKRTDYDHYNMTKRVTVYPHNCKFDGKKELEFQLEERKKVVVALQDKLKHYVEVIKLIGGK
jgi:hypothetical protein